MEQRKTAKASYEIIILFFNIADILNGFHLVTISSVDALYGSAYVAKDVIWRRSFVCNLISALSMFANLIAVFFLALLAISRLCVIKYPINTKLKELGFIIKILVSSVFLVTAIISTNMTLLLTVSKEAQPLPLCLMYGTSGRISSAIALFYASVQLLGAVCISVIYISVIFNLQKEDQSKASLGQTGKGFVTGTLLAKLVLVNISNFLCWILSSIVLFTSAIAKEYPISLLFWLTLVLTPTNSILNPCLLRLKTIHLYRRQKRMRNVSRKSTQAEYQ